MTEKIVSQRRPMEQASLQETDTTPSRYKKKIVNVNLAKIEKIIPQHLFERRIIGGQKN